MIIIEPLRGKYLLWAINNRASSDAMLFHIISILADIFVFSYPILLIRLFYQGFHQKRKELQHWAISIFVSTIFALFINIAMQMIIQKDRPESLPWLKLILQHIPSVSFPSDHATVSMWIAMWFLLIICNHIKLAYWKTLMYLLFIFSIIMGICRVAVAVHRPTDIIAWRIIGIIWWRWGYRLYQSNIWKIVGDRTINNINTIFYWIQNQVIK